MADPKKTQYINQGRALAQQLCNVLKSSAAYNQEMNKLGFVSGGSDAITQDDLDAMMAQGYPPGTPGSLPLADWDGGVYAIGKNATDYAGGEDVNLLKISI
jgi:hypothetical protein